MEDRYIDTFVVAVEGDTVRIDQWDHLGKCCSYDLPIGGGVRTFIKFDPSKEEGLACKEGHGL